MDDAAHDSIAGGCRRVALPASKFELEGEPEGDADFERAALACPCGGEGFRVIGWPWAAVGPGGMLRRTLGRVLREARAAMTLDRPATSLFWLPLTAVCIACSREAILLDDAALPGRIAESARGLPRESHRCRVCRRGEFSLAIGVARGADPRDRAACEIRAHCRACHRATRLAFADARPSEQARTLDLLYGRR